MPWTITMTEHEWELLIKKLDDLSDDVKDVKKEMGSLKVKVAGFAAFIGAVFSIIFK